MIISRAVKKALFLVPLVGLVVGCGSKARGPAQLRSITLAPSPITLGVSEHVQVTATGLYSDGTTKDLSVPVVWSSSNLAVATVGSGAVVNAVGVGQSIIKATMGSVSGSVSVTVTAATLRRLAVTPSAASIARGTTQQFIATGTYSDGKARDLSGMVTWSTHDQTIAVMLTTAQQAGTAKGMNVGKTDVTATLGSVTGSATLTVTAASLQAIDVTPAQASLPAGETQAFVATGSYSDGTTQDITPSVSWTSSDTAVATVSSAAGFEGTASAVGHGTATITATLGAVSGSAALAVTDAVLTSLDVTPAATPSLPLGTTQALTATGVYSDGTTHDLTDRVDWSSSDATMVSVSSATGSQGVATAMAAGTATITATLSGVSGTATITATSATLDAIALQPAPLSIAAGIAAPLTASGVYSDGTTKDLTADVLWSSSDVTVLTVDASGSSAGRVKGVAPGTAVVSAVLNGVQGTLSVLVTDATLASISVSPPSPSVPSGMTQGFIATGHFSDGSTQDLTAQVTWAASDGAVARISNAAGSQGLVTAMAAGSATVTATAAGGISGQAALAVVDAVLVSLSVSPADPMLAKGTIQAFDVVGLFSDGSSRTVTAQATWSSSDSAIVGLSNAAASRGVGTCLAPGGATVTASLAGISGSTRVTVTSAVVVSLAVEPPGPSLAAGTTLALTAIATYSDATTQDVTDQATWGSSDGTVASVSNASGERGLVRALDTGTTTASAQLAGVSGTTTVTVTAATLVSLSVSPANPSIAKGTTRTLVATGTYSDGTTQDLSTQAGWTSSDDSVAAVSSGAGTQGRVTAMGVGVATVTATVAGVSGSASVTVTGAVLTALSITPPSASLAKGTRVLLAASGSYSDGSAQDLTDQVSWSSSDDTVASVSNSAGTHGRVTGAAVGAATITATLGGVTASAMVTVTSALLTSIAIMPPDAMLAKGTTVQATATGTYSDGTTQDLTAQATWSAGDATIAVVSNAGSRGRVSGAGVGTTTLSAALGNISGSTSVTVTAATLVSIAINPPSASLAKGTQASFAASGTYSDGTVQDLTAQASWMSSNAGVAAVSSSGGTQGRVTGMAVGPATIYATLGGVTGSAAVTVTGAVLTSIALTPPDPSLAKGTTVQMTATGTYSDGTTQDLTAQAGWSAGDATIAGVSNTAGSQGRVSGVGVGVTTLSAALGGLSGSTSVTVTAATLLSIAINPPSASLAKGTQAPFAASGTYSDGTVQDLTAQASWTSSDASVAAVSSGGGTQGRVTGLAVGPATIYATLAGVSGSAAVTVTSAVLTSIAITPPNPTLAKGTAVQMTATGTYSDGTTQNLTAQAAWSAGDATIAGVSNTAGSQGRVSGAGVGMTTLSAALGGVSGSTSVTVTAATLLSIAINPPSATLAKGTQASFAASGTYSDGTVQNLTAQASWTSSDASVAAVSSGGGTQGRVTGVAVGPATIYATLGGVTGSAAVTVTGAVLASIAITPPDSSLAKGTTVPMTATGTYSDGTDQDVTTQVAWNAGDATIAAVSNAAGSQGLVTGVAPGSTTLSATLAGVTGTTGVTVTAATLVSIGIAPTDPTLAKGTTSLLTATGIYSDLSTQDLTAQVTWSTSAPSVATVSNASGSRGLVTAAGIGTATVTALMGGVSATTSVTVTNATLTAIDVNPVDPIMAAGTTALFSAIGTFSDGTIQDLTAQVSWASTSNAVVTVSNTSGTQGLTSAVAAGTADVSATLSGVSGTSTVTVTAATLTALAVTPANPQAAKGTMVQLTATGMFSDGSTQDVTAQVAWTSSQPTVASVSNAAGTQGLATAIAAGTTTLSATMSGMSASTTMTVTNAVLTSIAITPPSPSLPRGYRLQLRATGTFSDGTTQNLTVQATWTSSSTTVATISNATGTKGLATGVAAGTTTVSASALGVLGSTTLTVSNATLVSLAVTPANVTLNVLQTQQLVATGTFSDGSTLDITTQARWSSSAKKTVSVNRTGGFIRARKKGSATITATASGLTDSITVTVN